MSSLLHLSRRLLASIALVGGLVAASSAAAQYEYDTSHPEDKANATRYFGAVKDERGAFVGSATVTVQYVYVFTTDTAGQFKGHAPSALPASARIGCSKPGYKFLRASRRDGMTRKAKWVQIDCVVTKKP